MFIGEGFRRWIQGVFLHVRLVAIWARAPHFGDARRALQGSESEQAFDIITTGEEVDARSTLPVHGFPGEWLFGCEQY
jgi:hypothetical protein